MVGHLCFSLFENEEDIRANKEYKQENMQDEGGPEGFLY